MKGKPHFADFNLVPYECGGFVHPWIDALAMARVGLEELRLKKMVASDESLELLSSSFASFPVSCARLFLSATGTNRRGKEFGKNKLIS